jgi:hypothetical protein
VNTWKETTLGEGSKIKETDTNGGCLEENRNSGAVEKAP